MVAAARRLERGQPGSRALPVPAFLPLDLRAGHLQVAGVPRQAVLIWQQHVGGEESRSRRERDNLTQLHKRGSGRPRGASPGQGGIPREGSPRTAEPEAPRR